jgi:hypothetical protein
MMIAQDRLERRMRKEERKVREKKRATIALADVTSNESYCIFKSGGFFYDRNG